MRPAHEGKERMYWIPFGTRHSLVILRAHQNSRYIPPCSDVLHRMWAGFQIFNNKSVTLILIRRLKAATSITAGWRLSSKIIEMLLRFNSAFIQVHISELCEAFILTTPFHQRKGGKKTIPNWIEPRTPALITTATPDCCIQLVMRPNFTPRSKEMLLTFICECKTVIFHDSKRLVDAAGCTLLGSKLPRQMGGLWWSTDQQGFLMKSPQWREATSRERGGGFPSPRKFTTHWNCVSVWEFQKVWSDLGVKKCHQLKVLAWQGKALGAVAVFSLILLI